MSSLLLSAECKKFGKIFFLCYRQKKCVKNFCSVDSKSTFRRVFHLSVSGRNSKRFCAFKARYLTRVFFSAFKVGILIGFFFARRIIYFSRFFIVCNLRKNLAHNPLLCNHGDTCHLSCMQILVRALLLCCRSHTSSTLKMTRERRWPVECTETSKFLLIVSLLLTVVLSLCLSEKRERKRPVTGHEEGGGGCIEKGTDSGAGKRERYVTAHRCRGFPLCVK